MTFGEKLKEARKNSGLSQEQLAEKLSVSRSAVAKWEADNGMPDISNLKAISQLLSVSIDHLLSDDEKLSFNEIREPIDLDSYQKHDKCRDRRDAAVFAHYSDAGLIQPLIRHKKKNKLEWLVDFIVQPGIIQINDYLEDSSTYYLVEKDGRQILVRVSQDFITSCDLVTKVDPKKFTFGKYLFRRAPYTLT